MGTSLDGLIASWYACSAVANKIISLSLSLSLSHAFNSAVCRPNDSTGLLTQTLVPYESLKAV